jgi:hypothetical protein
MEGGVSEQIQAMKLVVKMAEAYETVCPAGSVAQGGDFLTAKKMQSAAMKTVDAMIKEAESEVAGVGAPGSRLEAVEEASIALKNIAQGGPEATWNYTKPVCKKFLETSKVLWAMAHEAAAADADPWGKVKLALEAIDDTNLPIESILAISTAHILYSTSERMQGGDINAILVYEHKGYGWMVFVPSDPPAWEEIVQANLDEDVPDDLLDCMKKAHDLGCCWLLLDGDADEVVGLKTYEWL